MIIKHNSKKLMKLLNPEVNDCHIAGSFSSTAMKYIELTYWSAYIDQGIHWYCVCFVQLPSHAVIYEHENEVIHIYLCVH